MKWHFPDLRYDCLRCGKSCRAPWGIELDRISLERLEATGLPRRLRARGRRPVVNEGGRRLLGRSAEGPCLFFGGDGLCRIHREYGRPAKPRACRQYPFFLAQTPAGVFVGVSFRCTAVQRNEGRPLAAHREELEELAAEADYRLPSSIPVARGREIDWKGYLRVEGLVKRCLEEAPDLDAGIWQALCAVAREAAGISPGEPSPPSGSFSSPGPSPPSGCPPPSAGGGPRRSCAPRQDFSQAHAAGVLGLLEASHPGEIETLGRAIHGGRAFLSRTFGRRVDPAQLAGVERSAAWLEAEIARYVHHLIFRKYLAGPPSLLGRLCLLHLVPPLLRWYARASALLGGRKVLSREDLELAWDVVDGRLVSHNPGVGPLLEALEEGVLGLFR